MSGGSSTIIYFPVITTLMRGVRGGGGQAGAGALVRLTGPPERRIIILVRARGSVRKVDLATLGEIVKNPFLLN